MENKNVNQNVNIFTLKGFLLKTISYILLLIMVCGILLIVSKSCYYINYNSKAGELKAIIEYNKFFNNNCD